MKKHPGSLAGPGVISLRALLVSSALALAGGASENLAAQTVEKNTDSAKSLSPAAGDMRAELKELLPRNQLVGKGRLTYWGFQVYDARLWAAPGFKPGDLVSQAFALELDYLRDFTGADIAERSIVEMRRSADISNAQANAWIADMQRVIPDVKKGDRIMGIHRPDSGVSFLVNGKSSGEIRDAVFAKLFFGIWLSPKTSEPKLRSALLAGAL